MTQTDELRRILDERGIEYETDDAQVSETEWYYVTKLRDGYRDRWTYEEPPDCDLLVSYQYDLGAEDAIAATVGTGTLTAEQVSNATYAHSIHADCADADWQAIADELNDTLGRGTCHMVYNDLANLSRCTACGWRMEGVPMYYCPRCGRKVVDG